MPDAFIGLDESATIDKRLDAESRTVGANTVLLERIRIAGAVVGNYMDVNGSSEGLVHDADVLTAVNGVTSALGPLATEATAASILASLDVALSTRASEATLSSLDSKDFATQTTLVAVLAQLDVALSTRASEATLSTLEGKDFATQATLASVLSQLDVALSTRASEDTLAGRFDVVTSEVGTKSTAAQETLVTPGVGLALRIVRVWIRGANTIADGTAVEFTLRTGATIIDQDEVVQNQPYVHANVREGAADEVLSLQLSAAEKVYYVIDTQEFTP